MITLFIIGVLIAISCVCRAVKDKISHHYSESIFSHPRFRPQFWNPQISYRNKWKSGDKRQGERFLFSSTALVLLTDAWHLLSSMELLSIHLAVAIAVGMVFSLNIILMLIGVKLIYAVFFNLFYDRILMKS